ncbi:DUF1853 family protein [Vogesella oryzae]|uniref:DUF1853 family protein n=1 Tax=Vogesella oryzae TaxID=1735285 RepID=UPI0015824103|nr:DUF1853 family protein [Vogesella oryzae]
MSYRHRLADGLRALRCQPVRDLAFLLSCPPPWHSGAELDCARLLGPQGWPQLLALDAAPQPLLDWLAAHPTRRLGVYAELLLQFWFEHAPHIDCVAANLPLAEHGRSIGEFDYLLRIDGQPLHLEAASKFYLQLDDASGELVGPSLRDAWPLKYRKLASQLALSCHPAAQLPAGFAGCPAYSRLSGWLFYPAAPRPTFPCNTDACCGWWRRLSEPWPQHDADSRWLVLPRLCWLAPARAADEVVLTLAQLQAELALADGARLVAELVIGADGDWHEIARGFVVRDDWPLPGMLAELQRKLAAS